MTTLYLILAGVGVVLFLIWLVIRYAGKAERAEAVSEGLQDSVEKGKKHHERKSNVSRLSDSDYRKRLLDWERKR